MWYLLFSGAQKEFIDKKINLTNLSKNNNHLYIYNRMLLCLGDQNQQTVSSEL